MVQSAGNLRGVRWSVFEENSSSVEALIDFAFEKTSLAEFKRSLWDPQAKKEVCTLIRRSSKEHARELARRALRRRGLV